MQLLHLSGNKLKSLNNSGYVRDGQSKWIH